MSRLVRNLIVAALAFIAGVSAHAVWDRKDYILDVYAELIMNYQG
jgi:hypothetical protein